MSAPDATTLDDLVAQLDRRAREAARDPLPGQDSLL